MKTVALILGWFVLGILAILIFMGLALIGIVLLDLLRDWIKRKFKK